MTQATQDMLALVRSSFESWFFGADAPAHAFSRAGDNYKYAATNSAWNAWQAAYTEAVRAQAAPAWLPIESAPKGRKLLVGYSNQLGKWRTVTATYYPPDTLEMHEDHDWDDNDSGFAPEGWYEETETHDVTFALPCIATHWMPLPPPPGIAPTVKDSLTARGTFKDHLIVQDGIAPLGQPEGEP